MGCDGSRMTRSRSTSYFNPRTHVGCDPSRLEIRGSLWISIHAPTWGATAYKEIKATSDKHFNPRTHVGCDDVAPLTVELQDKFQSTHPRGVRPPTAEAFFIAGGISIHAPTWGATYEFRQPPRWLFISIHAPTWGATLGTDGSASEFLFQSTHPRGVRLLNKRELTISQGFQSTHPRGVRQLREGHPKRQCDFNPRTHVGCDAII